VERLNLIRSAPNEKRHIRIDGDCLGSDKVKLHMSGDSLKATITSAIRKFLDWNVDDDVEIMVVGKERKDIRIVNREYLIVRLIKKED